METELYRFGDFVLDPADRRLLRGAEPVEVNARYLDALALLVREQGRLVTKDRFLDEVWRGVPVTDEALTQCIRTLRRQLGDDAARPSFIETVPKHGYRFVAPVAHGEGAAAAVAAFPASAPSEPWRRFLLLGGAGALGGAVAGLIGGLIYGMAGALHPAGAGPGAISVLLVVVCVTIVLALLGGAGVGLGIAASDMASGRLWRWSAAGGAAGGMLVGAAVKLLGLDAFDLLFGQSPGDITGPAEGFLLGGAVGFGGWLASRLTCPASLGRAMAIAGLVGGAAGLAIPLLGGRLLGGSLDLLARQMPGSRLRLDEIGALFGETGLGPVSQAVTGGLEGLLFASCVVGATILANRSMAPGR